MSTLPRIRLASGAFINDDVVKDLSNVGVARAIIAATLGISVGRVRLVNPSTHAQLDNDSALCGDVQAIFLTQDPEAERHAELCLFHAMGGQRIEELLESRALTVSGMQLTALPESFGQLTALSVLWLDQNDLLRLPDSFGQLTCLRTVNLRHNDLRTLPQSFGQLTALERLWLNGNRLQVLPESFGQLTNLLDLWLHKNELKVLPESFVQLRALRALTLRENELRALPEGFGQLAVAQHLDIDLNQLTTSGSGPSGSSASKMGVMG